MQALIHRPREQIYETLNVICELMPGVSVNEASLDDALAGQAWYPSGDFITETASDPRKSANRKRIELLSTCQDKVKRFATILLPTLTHAYTSTVNLSVRQKVLTAQLKMLSNLDTSILESALRTVPFSSYLASILSQQDHPALVLYALQSAELLLARLEHVYGYQFFREGVMTEVRKLASQPLQQDTEKVRPEKSTSDTNAGAPADPADKKDEVPVEKNDHARGPEAEEVETEEIDDDDDEDGEDVLDVDVDVDVDDLDEDDEDDDEDLDDEIEVEDVHPDVHDDISASPSTSSSEQNYPSPRIAQSLHDRVIIRAKKLCAILQDPKSTESREKANEILHNVKTLATSIRECYTSAQSQDGLTLFKELSKYFTADTLRSITSAELLNSEIVDVLLDVFDVTKGKCSPVFPRTEPLT